MGDAQFDLDNFNLNNSEVSWMNDQANVTPSRNPRDLGGKIATISGDAAFSMNTVNSSQIQSPEFGTTNPNATPVANQNKNIELPAPGNPLETSANSFPRLANNGLQLDNAPQLSGQSANPTSAEIAGAALKNSESVIRTTDVLNDAGVEAVNKEIAELGRSGDAAKFYKNSRNLTEENVTGSYKDQGEWAR